MRKARAIAPQDRKYYKEWIRADFQRSRHVIDIDEIKYLISVGNSQLKVLETNASLSKA